MSALIIGLVVFGCVFGGALLGVFLRSRLPHHHMSEESKDSIKVGMGVRMLEENWSRDGGGTRSARSAAAESLFAIIQGLSPKNDLQRSLQSQALSMLVEIGKTRWLMYEQGTTSISMPMLVLLVLWLTAIFISFGLFAPSNVTVIASLFVSALSVSGAIYLILEMYAPYTGLIRISSAPLQAAIAQLGQ